MAELRGLANNRASEAADDPVYGHVATRTESYEAPKRCNNNKLVTKERTIERCNYCDSEFPGLILARVRGHLAGQPLLAAACGISCCAAVPAEVAELFATLLRNSRWERTTRPSSSARATSPPRHSPRRNTQAGNRQSRRSLAPGVSAGDADEATAALFSSADIPHVIINTQLWKDVVKVLKVAPASYMAPNRDRLIAAATSAGAAAPPLPNGSVS